MDNFTFEQARDAALTRLSSLGNFFENLDSEDPQAGFLKLAIAVRLIEDKIKKASCRLPLDSEFKQLGVFAQALIEFRPYMEKQLKSIWELYHEVFQIMIANKSSSEYYNLQYFINAEVERIEESDALVGKVTSQVKINQSTILSPLSLLLIEIIRAESIEDAIRKQLEDTLMIFGLQDKYNVTDICSVESKVERGRTRNDEIKWVTDVRAIRDATAHGRFSINQSNSWTIAFKNTKDGYNFNKSYTREEFVRFFDRHSLLYKFQLHLWMILELLPLFATHLNKRQINQ